MTDGKTLCLISDCGNAREKREFCNKHYRRWLKYGDPLSLKATERGKAQKYFYSVVLGYEGEDCLIWPYARGCGRGEDGYGRLQVLGKLRYVHRLVCEEANGPPPTPKHDAAHSCGRGHLGCVTKRHLSWKTRKENDADKIIHGTSNRGEKRWNSKLSEEQAKEIISLKGKEFQRETAKRFGVSRGAVAKIWQGRSWGWLKEGGSQ